MLFLIVHFLLFQILNEVTILMTIYIYHPFSIFTYIHFQDSVILLYPLISRFLQYAEIMNPLFFAILKFFSTKHLFNIKIVIFELPIDNYCVKICFIFSCITSCVYVS